MKYKLHLSISGSPARPSCFTTAIINSEEKDPDFQRLAYAKLKAGAYHDISIGDIKVNAIILQEVIPS